MNTDRQELSGACADADDDADTERRTLEPSLGFKGLTRQNYLKTDPILRGFKQRDALGETRVVSPTDWAGAILAVELDARVPMEVQRLFAVARGAMVYGCMFYPALRAGCGAAISHGRGQLAHTVPGPWGSEEPPFRRPN